MSGRGILDADMRTLAAWAVGGWHWWVGELAELVPARLRALGRRRLPRLHDRGGMFAPEAGRATPRAGARATIVLAPGTCLLRPIERPVRTDRDLRAMLAIEGDRLLPFADAGAIIAGRIVAPAGAPGRSHAIVAGMPGATARALAERLAATNLRAAEIVVESADAPPIDFAPAMRAAGLLPRHRSAAPFLWVLVGFLAMLNVAVLVWRDVARVERAEQLVAQQQPAVAIAQQIGRRVAATRAAAARSVSLRRRQDPLAALVAVQGALPAGAWLQRYAWDGATVRLSGYRPRDADVTTALRTAGGFADVQASGDALQASLPTGEPFEVSARIVSR